MRGDIMPENVMWCTQSCPWSPVATTTRLTTRFIMSVLGAKPGKTLLRLFPIMFLLWPPSGSLVTKLVSTWLSDLRSKTSPFHVLFSPISPTLSRPDHCRCLVPHSLRTPRRPGFGPKASTEKRPSYSDFIVWYAFPP